MKRIIILLLSAVSLQLSAIGQGSLTPPGPPTPTMKALDQVEPRTIITNLPYVINQPGSYYFVTNLTGGTGITIAANDVTLDLNGFALIGGTGSGMSVSGTRSNLCIRNGTVRGWATFGVAAAGSPHSQFERLRIASNTTGTGLATGENCTINDCTFVGNATGLSTADRCSVTRCTAVNNASGGIVVGDFCIVRECTVHSLGGIRGNDGCIIIGCVANGTTGIGLAGNARISDCVAVNGGTGTGIVTSVDSTISGCTVVGNARGIQVGNHSSIIGCNVSENTGTGIVATVGCTIKDCTVGKNSGPGISVIDECLVIGNDCTTNGVGAIIGDGILVTGRRNRIEGNQVVANDVGINVILASGENLIIKNSSANNGAGIFANYSIVAGNFLGETNVITSGIISDTNPWRNFSF